MSKITQLEKKVRDLQVEINKLHMEEHKSGHGTCPHCGICKCCGRSPNTITWPQYQWVVPNMAPIQWGTITGGSGSGFGHYSTNAIDVTNTANSTTTTAAIPYVETNT